MSAPGTGVTIDCSKPSSKVQPPVRPAAPATRTVITARGVTIPAHAKAKTNKKG